MEELLQLNNYCADCYDERVDTISTHFGVFICNECAEAHKALGLPVKSIGSALPKEEIDMLLAQGNSKINNKLLREVPPWTAAPSEFKLS